MEGQAKRKHDSPCLSYMWQALRLSTVGFAPDHLHWMTRFVWVCWPNVGKEKVVVSA